MNYTIAIIIFSKDRAMQLHACISSLRKYVLFNERADCFVLYKSEKYQYQYKALDKEFKEVYFVQETSLVEQTHAILEKYDTVLFVVDDTLFYRDFNLAMCVYHLFNNPKVLGFSLRLGYNTNWSHIGNTGIKRPPFTKIVNNYYQFNWVGKNRDFGYPLEVSSSLYRTRDIVNFFKDIKGNPGDIESHLHQQRKYFLHAMPHLLCFGKSVAFTSPVNVVRNTRCPSGRNFPCSTEKLAALFDKGKRIDILSIPEEIIGVHQEVEYKFK